MQAGFYGFVRLLLGSEGRFLIRLMAFIGIFFREGNDRSSSDIGITKKIAR